MGDCLLLTSPLRALKQEFPGFRISVLVEPRFAGCFANNPDIHRVIPAGGKLASAANLLSCRFHAIINLHGGPTSLFYSIMAWGRRVGAAHYQYAWLYHGLVPPPDPAVHSVESTMNGFRWLGVRAEHAPPLRYEIQSAAAERMKRTFKDEPYVVIHPSSLMSTKRWDAALFAEVARTLKKRLFTIALTCGPGEEAQVAEVAKGISQTTMMLGLSIPELAELIRGAKLYIGNDSGPMHLAAAVGTPTIAIWGSSDSRRWRPWSVEHRVVQNPFECNPCPGYRCLVASSPLCIESVTVKQVEEAIEAVLTMNAH